MKRARQNTVCFSFPDIEKLEWIKQGNELPNFDWFLENVFNKESISDLFELWEFSKMITGCNEESRSYEWFKHELGTLLISCKEWHDSFSHGMRYGNLDVTTYHNNSIPNLYVFGVTFNEYGLSPVDLKETE